MEKPVANFFQEKLQYLFPIRRIIGLGLTPCSAGSHKQRLGRGDARGDMQRGFLLLRLAALCATMASCAPFVANHDSEVQLRTVQTPAGSLRLAVIEEG